MDVSASTHRLRSWLGLERNIIVMLAALVVLGMGEELWARYIPKYLEVLGASAIVISAYGTLRDLLDAIYQYPGGWIVDHAGRKRALIIFTLLAIIGYAIYAFSESWIGILVGTLFVMAWGSLTLPAIFAIIGDHLPKQRRAIGFGVQAIVKRIPIAIAPVIGGVLIASYGFSTGLRIGFYVTIALALATCLIIWKSYADVPTVPAEKTDIREIWRSMDRYLKRLLVADILARWAEGIPKVFIILYSLNILGVSPVEFGWLTTIQALASVALYIPLAKLADEMNRKPFVLITFIFFALFPLALVSASSFGWILLAFTIAGLREVGEPARKAFIVDLSKDSTRGRAVGLYYLIRGLAVFPAPLIGGWLWTMNPQFPFYVAFGIGTVGCLMYAIFGPNDQATKSRATN